MAARGNMAKERVGKILREAFGDNYIAEQDKKHYVWVDDDGERVQIAISMTCPKTPIEIANNVVEDDSDWDFSDDGPKVSAVAVTNAAPAEITEQEVQNIEEMMKRLGL
jgi:hypothetical protein